MNGARTTYMRKGYLLTALTAAVLLAASSGTAWAQVEDINIGSVAVDAADSNGFVPEGSVTGVTVVLTKTLPVGFSAEVTLAKSYGAAAVGDMGYAEDNDIVVGTTVSILGGRDRGSTQMIVNHDVDAVDEKFQITASALRWDGTPPATTVATIAGTITERMTPASGKIVEDEVQDYVVTTTTAQAAIKEGTIQVDLSLRADPPRPTDEAATVYLRADDPTYGLAPMAAGVALIEVSESAVTVNVTTPANDKNRTDDTVTVTGFTGAVVSAKEVFSHSITVLDIHMLPAADAITAEAKDAKVDGMTVTAVDEGGTVYVWVSVGNSSRDQVNDAEAFTVSLSATNPGQTGDFRSSPSSLGVTAGLGIGNQKTVGPFMLEALEDQDVGMETLMLSLNVSGAQANGPGSSSGAFSIDIGDKTEKQVEPKTEAEAYPKIEDALEAGSGDEGFNPGESFSVMTSDLFTVADGYDARYGVSVSGDAVSVSASSDTVTVDAKKAGTSKVTITATAEMEASSFKPGQTVASMADIMFEVTVVDKMLAVMLEMPANVMDGNIVEGMSYEIMVSANRMVMEDTEVMIMRDRAGSSAGEDDFSVSMATIMAGYDSATAELMVTEDDMPDGGTDDNMSETLVLFGMVNGEQTNALTFNIWDKAVPALPLFGQLLLALFLMLGGARLYRRRQG